MYRLIPSKRFLKKYSKIVGQNKLLAPKIQNTLKILSQDPYYNSLKTHKIFVDSNTTVRSSWVKADLRIIWDFSDDEINVIDLLDLGNHNEVY
jgi:mRNA-degrading endonuclease YafQ of YafQ-DinJ toxin-antitoxin module